MLKFAVIEDGIILNTIVAESKKIAEEVTGKVCVKYTDEAVEIGGSYIDNQFTRPIQPKPYPSWVSNGGSGWNPPVAYPEVDIENPKNYTWNENTVSWVEA